MKGLQSVSRGSKQRAAIHQKPLTAAQMGGATAGVRVSEAKMAASAKAESTAS
jgi:hypothetical protein